MITTLLISRLADYLAGVLHTTLVMMTKIDPDFEKGSIAFYQNEFGFFPCRIVGKKTKRPNEVRISSVGYDFSCDRLWCWALRDRWLFQLTLKPSDYLLYSLREICISLLRTECGSFV